MDNLPYLFAGLALTVGALALITVWSKRRAFWKTVAVLLMVTTLPLGYLAYLDLLSKPKPLRLELRHIDQVDVISAVLQEGEAIYLWLNVDGRPRYYEMPWDENLALQLQSASREARRAGTGVAMRPEEALDENLDGTVEDAFRERFYAVPVPQPPPEKRRVIVQSPDWEL